MADWVRKILDKEINRRDFLKHSATGVAGLTLAGSGSKLTSVATAADSAAVNGVTGEGKLVPVACWFGCGGRCHNAAYVVDNVVVRQQTDDTHPDSPDYPQQRSCLRGRSVRKLVFGADRLKYPMKRKHWQPLTGGDKSLRGIDEWERISWNEALDYVAAELKNAKEKYGNSSILACNWGDVNGDVNEIFNAFGGCTEVNDTGSFGTLAYVSNIIGIPFLGVGGANDRFDLRKSETIVLYGNNPAWSALGSPSYNYWQAKKAGAKFVYVGPSYNTSADLYDAKWIRVRPGTDTAFLLAVAYTMITEDDPVTNPIIDWDFLARCTVGFDAAHMPKDATVNENFKDYVLGKYDGQPKTPKWATEICGTPAEDILWFAREMRKDKKVSLLYGFAPARCNNADDFPQIITTIGAMGGHFGKSGHACGSGYGVTSGNDGPRLVKGGPTGAPHIPNPVEDVIPAPELWDAIIDGKYNSAAYFRRPSSKSKGIKDIDIHVICHWYRNGLQNMLGANRGIEAHRKVDFVVALSFSMCASAQYADIVLPISTHWERQSDFLFINTSNRELQVFPSKVIEPLYEAKEDRWINRELAKRLGLNADKIYPLSGKQRYFNVIAGTTVINEAGTSYEKLVTITEEDIAEWDVKGSPQKGKIGLKELMEKGIYQVERHEGDSYGNIAYKAFVKDPEKNPLTTKSGKFEIYCQIKADTINAMGRSKVKPYPTYVPALNGYEQSFSNWDNKIKGDYPYQMTNPHYPRRAHTVFDNIPWLREAMHNPVFINAQDAAEKGIKDGDTVLIFNQYGKVLRQASVTQQLMPGYIELPHGTWMDIDEKTGIDNSGSDNILCAPVTTGCGVSGYNTQLVNFEKYNGEPLEVDCLKPLKIVNI